MDNIVQVNCILRRSHSGRMMKNKPTMALQINFPKRIKSSTDGPRSKTLHAIKNKIPRFTMRHQGAGKLFSTASDLSILDHFPNNTISCFFHSDIVIHRNFSPTILPDVGLPLSKTPYTHFCIHYLFRQFSIIHSLHHLKTRRIYLPYQPAHSPHAF